MRLALIAAFIAVFAPLSARAEVASATPGAVLIRAETELAVSPEQAWRDLGRIENWWNGAHTYSGDASRLSLDRRAGGCWCERWGRGQSVEHGRVLMVMEQDGVRTLRVAAAFGPLQELAVNAVLTFTIEPHASGAKITMTYRVVGDSSLGLVELAPLVDMVLTEQFGRLGRYISSGSPD